MANYNWIEQNGKKILYMNLASKTTEELKMKISEFKPIIAAQPKESVLAITDIKDGFFSRDIVSAIKDFANANKPYIKMSVIIGLSGLQRVIYNSILRLTGRKNMVTKSSYNEAIEYLKTIQ